ncbi:MAG: hypothetical protein WA450_16205, partial [Candidatus Acidiferrales bacterium]
LIFFIALLLSFSLLGSLRQGRMFQFSLLGGCERSSLPLRGYRALRGLRLSQSDRCIRKDQGKANCGLHDDPLAHFQGSLAQTKTSCETISYRGPVGIEIGRNGRLDE